MLFSMLIQHAELFLSVKFCALVRLAEAQLECIFKQGVWPTQGS